MNSFDMNRDYFQQKAMNELKCKQNANLHFFKYDLYRYSIMLNISNVCTNRYIVGEIINMH